MCEVKEVIRGDNPKWQAPMPKLLDDPVNAPFLARYLAFHAGLVNKDHDGDDSPKRTRKTD